MPDTTFADCFGVATEHKRRRHSDLLCIVDRSLGEALGYASYYEADPPNGLIEIGGIHFTEPLKRTVAATEAMYLMLRAVFDLGYRRCEWRCDALNGPSRAAAERLGFSFEGIFRQHWVYNGRNRDTA